MNQGDAYRVLAEELNSLSRAGYNSLVPRIGHPTQRTLRIGNEDVLIETHVHWDDAGKESIRVISTAFGPTCWRIERLEESIVVHPPTELL